VLTLQQSIDEALKNNNSIKIAEYNINVQQALKKEALLFLRQKFPIRRA
jgi:hypothetical protein